MPRTKDETISICTTGEVKVLLRQAAKRERALGRLDDGSAGVGLCRPAWFAAGRPDDKTRYPEKTDLMTANALLNLDQLEASLWEAADRSVPAPNSPPANIVCQCWV